MIDALAVSGGAVLSVIGIALGALEFVKKRYLPSAISYFIGGVGLGIVIQGIVG